MNILETKAIEARYQFTSPPPTSIHYTINTHSLYVYSLARCNKNTASET